MNVFDVADWLTPVIEALMFFMLFEAFLKRRAAFPAWSCGVGGLILAALIALSNYFFQFSILNALLITTSAAFVACIFYYGAWYRLVLVAVFGALVIGVTEMLTLYLLSLTFSLTVDEAMQIVEYRFLGVLVSKLLGLAVCNVIRITRSRRQYQENKAYWALFVLLFAGSLVASFLIMKLTYESGTTTYNSLAVVSAFALFFGTFFALYLYERLERQSALLQKQTQYEQHLKGQLKYLDELLIKQKELRSFQHDVTNQLVALKGYFANGEAASGMQHIDTLLQRVGAATPAFDTGNTALDAILSTKQTLAKSKDISFEARIRIGMQLDVDSVDLSVIFGNALDNALEACDRLPDNTDKKIILILTQDEQTLFCQLANTAPPKEQAAFATSKPDKENHGYGLANLTAALANYGGEPMVSWEDGWFTLSFMLFMNDTSLENEK